MLKRTLKYIAVVGLGAVILMCCASKPEIKPQPEPTAKPTPPPAPAKFTMKPHHFNMQDQMRISYEKADEIIVGIYTGNRMDEEKGLIFYFDKVSSFDKTTLSWGSIMNALLPIFSPEIELEIITQGEFEGLSDLDRVGICWDSIDQERYVYIVEGQPTLVFFRHLIDEANNTSYRNLIDTYPATKACNARAVFDLMVRDLAGQR
jgi:hypothetical protein